MVHVAPFWAGWRDLGQASGAYQRLIDRLSDGPRGGRAFLIHDYRREARDRQLEDKLAIAGGDGEHAYPMWHWLNGGNGHNPSLGDRWITHGSDDHQALRRVIADGLDLCERKSQQTVAAGLHDRLVDQLNLFCVRFFFDHQHFEELLGDIVAPTEPEPGCSDPSRLLPYFVCIDLRFDIKIDEWWTFATLSLWSDWPRHPHMGPKPDDDYSASADADPSILSIPIEDMAVMRSSFDAVSRRFEQLLHGPLEVGGPPEETAPGHLGWSRPRLEVFDGVYRSPRLWFVVPTDPRPSRPLDYWPDDARHEALLEKLAGCFLKVSDPRADTVAAAQLQGDFLALRRFIHHHHGTVSVGDEPTYLVLPGDGESEQQEDLAHDIVRSLQDLEWHAATVLYEVDSDLEVARTHLRMYERNARRASVLLDALVLHLPGASAEVLRQVHGSIDLVHQTLLQGVADLADMTTVIQASRRKVGDGAEALVARFDREVDQRPVEERLDIRASLAERGLFERLEEQARDDVALAERVQTRYESLLREITMAFEERRVREADKLERYSGQVALVFGVIGAATALEAAFEFRWNLPPRPAGVMAFAVAVIAAAVLCVIAAGLWRYGRVGELSTKGFRDRYRDTWSFLAMTSTDSLRRLRAHINRTDDLAEHRRLWNQADVRFSSTLAKLWDQQPPRPKVDNTTTAALSGPRLDERKEVELLAERVDAFVCETLLVSERTPYLHRFALPRLTCLYRLLAATREQPDTIPDPNPRLVSDFDLRASLVNAGFPPGRWETFLEWERQLLDAHDPGTTAQELLDKIVATGLRHGLADGQAPTADKVIDTMWTNIREWRTSADT